MTWPRIRPAGSPTCVIIYVYTSQANIKLIVIIFNVCEGESLVLKLQYRYSDSDVTCINFGGCLFTNLVRKN